MPDTTPRKSRLAFIGLGLSDENGISMEGLREAENADVVYAESYTSALLPGSIDRLGERIGKRIESLGREDVEDGKRILESCVGNRVAFLVPGDPMSATTHIDLRLRAHRSSIETRVIHGSSALTAVPGILGLQHYKFGRTTTIPFPSEGYSPTSPYEVVAENRSRGLHTLILLDIQSEGSRYMTANEGLYLLTDMERRVGTRALGDESIACVVARAGAPDCVTRAGRIRDLVGSEFGPPLHTIVVPGKLHFLEAEALVAFAGMPKELSG